ncbi:fatty acid-binding protein, intestinal-like [Protopterus annectens]|uniref:fatty acid-binding protein, intestinal-like n=1 Tax=Protopterus annectens TaxID=7888 RepID=UPI001CFA74B5|nr:fatty acid-binding protein, intestinal-like [Protopterus annectens]
MAFDGTWKVYKNEDYDKFMEQMGVHFVKRKLGANDNLHITIKQDGNNFKVVEKSTFRTKEIEFTLGVVFDYDTADGTELNGDWKMDGNTLVATFTRKDNGKILITRREIVDGEMVQLYTPQKFISHSPGTTQKYKADTSTNAGNFNRRWQKDFEELLNAVYIPSSEKLALEAAYNIVILATRDCDLQYAVEGSTAECEAGEMKINTSKSEAKVFSQKRLHWWRQLPQVEDC